MKKIAKVGKGILYKTSDFVTWGVSRFMPKAKELDDTEILSCLPKRDVSYLIGDEIKIAGYGKGYMITTGVAGDNIYILVKEEEGE